MEDEINFTCEVCGKSFPADPDTMLECQAEFKAIDMDTGEVLQINDEMRKEILEDSQDDPELKPFLKGAVCICIECQDKFIAEADEITPEENPED